MKKLLLLSTLLLLPEISQAQIFKLRLVSGGGGFEQEIKDALEVIQNDINKDLPAASPNRLAEGMVNSQALSSKGMANDYISHFDKVLIGGGIGVGADLEKDKELDSDLSGLGVTGGVQLGLNMSMFSDKPLLGLDPKKLSVMFNFFAFNIDRNFDESSVNAKLLSFGGMASYKWIEGNGTRLFGWDGVRLHSGYQYSSTKLGFKSKIDRDINSSIGGGGTLQGKLNADPSANIESSTHSIPLEISSGVNFLYVLSFYGGVGTDINFGSSSAKGDLNSQNSNLCANATSCPGSEIVVATEADINANGKVQPLFLRGFAGFQVNLPYTRIYVHANNVFGTELYSVATGLRLAF